jgi:hypothetical protein
MENLEKLLGLFDLAVNSKVITPKDQMSEFESASIKLSGRYPIMDLHDALNVLSTLQMQGHISGTDTVEQSYELCISIFTSSLNTPAQPDFSQPIAPPKPIYSDPPSAYALATAEGRVVKLRKAIDMLQEGFDRPDGFLNRHDKIHTKLDKYRAELNEAEETLHKMMGRQ